MNILPYVLLMLGIFCLIAPFILTVFNILNLFKKKKIKENLIDILTFLLGIILTVILYLLYEFKDYNQALRLGGSEIELHSPIASWSMPTVLTISLVGIISYALIRIKKLKLPPLVIVGAMSGIFVCSTYIIIYIIQLSSNIGTGGILFLTLFPINYILCSIRAVMEIMKIYKEKNIQAREYKNKFLNKCSKIFYNIENWPIIAIVLSIPFTAILICILVLFGQRPDEAIKAFLETSDWTLSTKISPPSFPILFCLYIIGPLLSILMHIAITAIGIAHNISITIEATIPNILLTFIYILFLLCYIFIFIIILLL